MKQILCALAIIATVFSVSAQTNETPPASSTYRLPTVTVYGAQLNETQAVTQAANAVTVLSGEQIKPGGIQNTRELGTYLPNVTIFDANNDRSPKFSIRGLRENNFATGDPAVGFYVDDVPYTDLNSRGLALFDIEQIEFLRGPQPGLFGANAPGGVINVVTRQPGDVWEGRGGFTYGNYDQQIYEASLRGPIVAEKLSLGLSGLYSRRDGFVHNKFHDNHPDDKETLAGRAQLRWTPTETLDFSLILHGQKFNDGFIPTYYKGHDKSLFSVNRDFDGFVDTDTWGTAFKGSFENEVVKVTSISSYRNWKQDLLQDFDFSSAPIRLGFAKPELEQWSQELRVQSTDETKQLKWLGGFYYSNSDLNNNTGSRELTPITLSTVPAPFVILPTSTFLTRSDTDAETYAIFGQAGYDVTEKLNVIGGIRFTFDRRNIDRSKTISAPASTFGGFPAGSFSSTNGVYSASEDFTDISPKIGISYHCTPEFETYASISRGYQSGGFNVSNDTEAGAK
ncbi:MAG: TonB-dependent receptor, partial [Verrucomicrobiota bacterium]